MNADTQNVSSAYGLVSRGALESLQSSYDTRALLRGVESVDDLIRALRGKDGVRDQLLRVHGMAHTVVNGAGLSEPSGASLPDAAVDLIEQLSQIRTLLCGLQDLLAPLAGLAPRLRDDG